jgi:hypothetical protein
MPSFRQWVNSIAARRVITVLDRPLGYYVELLEGGHAFSFSRFGDGEWGAILGIGTENCDGHEYFPGLAAKLRAALVNELPYFYGMQHSALRSMGWRIAAYVRRFCPSRKLWHNADVFHYASRAGELAPFIRALRKAPVVVIGPVHLRRLSDSVFEYRHFVEIPSKNCFHASPRISDEIREYARRTDLPTVYLFSASMAANGLIHDLHPELGTRNWLIDTGSLWDGYAGVYSRSYFLQPAWKAALKKNLENCR